jgi:pilus assembly protein CpaC
MKGTDTPFTMGNLDSTKTGNSHAGFTIKIKPTMLQEEKINLKLELTVSTTISAPPAAPQTSNNSLNTEVIIKNNDSAAIGGMMSSSTTTNYDRPQGNTTSTNGGTALFSFLKSKEYTTDRVQFVFFITPEILDSASTGTNDVAKKFRKKGR